MAVRKTRFLAWTLTIIVAIGFIFGENFIRQEFFTEKTPILVYAPKDMEKAFKKALSVAKLKSEYKIVMTDDVTNADISIQHAKENDDNFSKLAFSPFVIGCNNNSEYIQELKEGNTIIQNQFDENVYQIDLLKVINEAIEDGSLKNLGIKEDNDDKIVVLYPGKNTTYWHDFYNFMLLTVNNGTYPETEKDMNRAIEAVERFEKSTHTEAVTDFDDKIERTGGFSEKSFYIIPEKTLKDLAISHSKNTGMFFPLKTTNFSYYIIANSEIGGKIAEHLGKEFHSKLKSYSYRSSFTTKLGAISEYVDGETNIYDVVEIPTQNFFTTQIPEE